MANPSKSNKCMASINDLGIILKSTVEEVDELSTAIKTINTELFEIHVNCMETLKKNPNITLVEWVKTFGAKSPIEKQVKDLSALVSEDYEGKMNLISPIVDNDEPKRYHPWETVYNRNPLKFVYLDIPEFDEVLGDRKVRAYVTAEDPESGYLEFGDGTVFKYSLKDNTYIRKLNGYKIEFNEESEEFCASCRLVKY